MAKCVLHVTLNTISPTLWSPLTFAWASPDFCDVAEDNISALSREQLIAVMLWWIFPNKKKKRSLFYPWVYVASLRWHRRFLEPKRRRQTSSVSFIASTHSSCVATYVGGTSKAANRSAQASVWRFQCVSRPPSLWSQQRGPLPAITADQNSHGRNYTVLAAGFGCGCSVFETTCHYVLHRARR